MLLVKIVYQKVFRPDVQLVLIPKLGCREFRFCPLRFLFKETGVIDLIEQPVVTDAVACWVQCHLIRFLKMTRCPEGFARLDRITVKRIAV